MFGGGMFSTMIKQSKINDARGELEAARYALRSFEKELQDVSRAVDLRIDIGSFLSFADFFFDNFFVDWMVPVSYTHLGRIRRRSWITSIPPVFW